MAFTTIAAGLLALAGYATGPSLFTSQGLEMEDLQANDPRSTALVPYNPESMAVVPYHIGVSEVVSVPVLEAAGVTVLTAALLSKARPIASIAGRIHRNATSIASWAGLSSENITYLANHLYRNSSQIVRWILQRPEEMASLVAIGAANNDNPEMLKAALFAATASLGIKTIKDLAVFVKNYFTNKKVEQIRAELDAERQRAAQAEREMTEEAVGLKQENEELREAMRDLEEIVALKNKRIIEIAEDSRTKTKVLETFAKLKAREDMKLIFYKHQFLPQLETEYAELDTDLVSLRARLSILDREIESKSAQFDQVYEYLQERAYFAPSDYQVEAREDQLRRNRKNKNSFLRQMQDERSILEIAIMGKESKCRELYDLMKRLMEI